MLARWPIRNKLLVGIGLLLVIVATLAASGFRGVYAYRSLVKSVSNRATELPLASSLSQQVADARVLVGELRALHAAADQPTPGRDWHKEFAGSLRGVHNTLLLYREQLDGKNGDTRITDSRDEWQTVRKISALLMRLEAVGRDPSWVNDPQLLDRIGSTTNELQSLCDELPSNLHQRMHDLASEVRTEYRTLIFLNWITTILGGLLLGLFLKLFYSWVFRPLRVLVKGSRRVAAGEFNHRIRLSSQDEMSELADALNDMTARFQAIRDDLDSQVQERTKQVVRSEQLASVGFLAAGVAHEINNPLASIAMCAESLEGRIEEVVASSGDEGAGKIIAHYLRMIQTEAFRCKGITERLLDFARMGDVQRQYTDLRELIQGVIDMVAHLGKYSGKHVEFADGAAVVAEVNPQEMKQVVLNLITNALDSLAPDGTVRIELRKRGSQAEIVVSDNGCGMTDEVLKHLFEPFFTRRRGGQGTGLGLSITYRIVADHNGHIDVHSDGPGKGSQFCVSLPIDVHNEQREKDHRYQAA
jgi:two-component system, NtrC family, sensor kinase